MPTLVSSQIARSGEHPFYVACSWNNKLAASLLNAYPDVCSSLTYRARYYISILLEICHVLPTTAEGNLQHGVVHLWMLPLMGSLSFTIVQTNCYITLDSHGFRFSLSLPIRTTTSAYRFPLSSFLLPSLFCSFSSFAHGSLILSIVPSRPCPLSAVKVTVCQWRLTKSSRLGISAPRNNSADYLFGCRS